MRLLILFISFLISQIGNGQILTASSPYRVRASGSVCTYPLDTYTGAAAAFSLRKLDADYAGSAIRVRRSSDNTEQDIGFVGCELDQSALTTFVGAGNGFIVTWYDQSGNTKDATESTAANQPIIVSSGTIITQDGKPTVSFGTDADDYRLRLPTGFLNGATALAYFHVATITDFASSNAAVFGPSTTFSTGLEILQGTVSSRRTMLRVNNTNRNNNAAAEYQLWNDAAQSLTSIFGNSTDMAAYKNGSSVTLTSTAAMPSLNFNGIYAIGAYSSTSLSIYGNIQEMIIYTTDQASNRTGIESNLNTYYSIY